MHTHARARARAGGSRSSQFSVRHHVSVVREDRKQCREIEGGFDARACVREWTTTLTCGVMLAASFDLVHEGEPYGPGYVILGVCVGAMFIAFMQRLLHDCEDVKFAALEGADARKTLLIPHCRKTFENAVKN